MAHDQSPAYVRPPVRQAGFTIYFEPLNFDMPLILRLQSEWDDDYPVIRQARPSSRRHGLPEVDIFAASWPMPAIEQSTPALNTILSYQWDQLSFRWNFDGDGESYPGYSKLSTQLLERFRDLASAVNDHTDSQLKLQGAQCSYTNSLTDASSFGWLRGFLGEWRAEPGPEREDMGFEYVGFRCRRVDRNAPVGTDREAWIQLDEGGKKDAELDVWAIVALQQGDTDSDSETLDPNETAKRLMDDAHAYAIDTFESSFSEEIKKLWEPK
ncbi:hypothetical protein [Nocardia noduli]|uniref:hypothetical protein n=1 Tax=Nocardia noduli TaxID=2815722 RepID=UPI001C2405B4|nr:hypothetical protein [Nocardia noduli]